MGDDELVLAIIASINAAQIDLAAALEGLKHQGPEVSTESLERAAAALTETEANLQKIMVDLVRVMSARRTT